MTAAQLALPMSTLDGSPSTISTLIEITENYTLASALTVSLTHDDGAGIYLDGSTTPIAGCNSTSEAAVSTQTRTLPAGSHSLTLLSAEDNTAPAILTIALPPEAVPEPASLALLGSALAGLGVFMRRRRNA